MTKFLADECCELSLVRELRSKGHNVTYVPELKRGMPDHDVLRISKNEERILITEDRDFGELVYRLNKPAYGIVLLKFDPLRKAEKLSSLIKLIDRYPVG